MSGEFLIVVHESVVLFDLQMFIVCSYGIFVIMVSFFNVPLYSRTLVLVVTYFDYGCRGVWLSSSLAYFLLEISS